MFNNIDREYNNTLGHINDSYNDFCSYLYEISNTLDSYQKAYLIYQLVTKNIIYDYANYKEGNLPNSEPRNVYSSKLAVYSGYSRLFIALLECLNFLEKILKILLAIQKD